MFLLLFVLLIAALPVGGKQLDDIVVHGRADRCLSERYHPAYSQEESLEETNPKWMAEISDSTPLSLLSIPGTHDTLSTRAKFISFLRCQSMNLSSQLEAGIRAIDIRCRHYRNHFFIHHSLLYLKTTFGQVMDTCREFLRRNPSEVILMRLKEEFTAKENNRTFEETFLAYLNEYKDVIHITHNQWNVQLGSVRGKVILLQNFKSTSGQYGIPYPNQFSIQDDFQLIHIWKLYTKWLKIKEQLHFANKSLSESTDSVYFANYLSGTGIGVRPCSVAGGSLTEGTKNSRAIFKIVSNEAHAKQYPDFPCCVFQPKCPMECKEMCVVLTEGTNVLTYELLRKQTFIHIGIIFADFPGPGLIRTIIDVSRRNNQIRAKTSVWKSWSLW